MALRKTTCGKSTVDYDDRCGYACTCWSDGSCNWAVACPDGQGGYFYTSGTGRVVDHPPTEPTVTVTVAGGLVSCAKSLERLWRRRITVPVSLRKKVLRKRALSGTPEKVAASLGIQLGARLRG